MGVHQIEMVLTSRWLQNPTGILINISIEDLLLELGFSSLSLAPETIKVGLTYCTTSSWIKHVMSFMLDHNIQLDLGPNKEIAKPRCSDTTIMETATAYTTHVPTLQAINRIRMELNAMWISDISNADGQSLDTRWTKKFVDPPQRNDYIWPKKHHTSPYDWTIWRKFLRDLCHHPSTTLRYTLGSWQGTSSTWINWWDSFVDAQNDILYIRTRDHSGWNCHGRQAGRQRRMTRYKKEYVVLRDIPIPANNLYQVSITVHSRYYEVCCTERRGTLHPDSIDLDPLTRIYSSKQSILTAMCDILQLEFLSATAQIDRLLTDFSRGTVISVSDGSYYPDLHRSAAAWIVESECGTQSIMCSMTTPGSSEDFTSYRSELLGLLGISVTLRILASGRNEPGHCIVGCDGEAALRSLTLPHTHITANSSNADLLSRIHDVWHSLRTKPLPIHIRGHTDTTGQPLTRLERLNIMMDRLATLTATTFPARKHHRLLPQIGLAYIKYEGKGITGTFSSTLYHKIAATALFQYLSTRLFDTPIAQQEICWKAIEYARNRTGIHMCVFITKWISNTLPTGVVMQRRKQRVFNGCPRCNYWGEDRKHILVCWDTRAKLIWNTHMKKINASLVQENTHPEIQDYIMTGLTALRNQKVLHTNLHMRSWQLTQHRISLLNFIAGFISQTMVDAQQYNIFTSSRALRRWIGLRKQP
jgi:hypothetical protein